jgi:[acyl-carrier-protein] S-malonyltransferase
MNPRTTFLPTGARERLAVLFPGQGSQKPGMGRALTERHPRGRELLREFSRLAGMDVEELLCSADIAADPVAVHLAMVGFGLLAWDFLTQERKLKPVMLAGHSLGEITALACADVLSTHDALRLAVARGQFIAEACAAFPGAMTAFVGAPASELQKTIEQWITAHEATDRLWVVNFNSPNQLVAAGAHEALQNLGQFIRARGISVVPLSTAGAFHTPFMAQAARKLFDFTRTLAFNPPRIHVVSSMTGRILTCGDNLAVHLALQLVNPVRWTAAMESMRCAQITRIVEAGPAEGTLCTLAAGMRHWMVGREVIGGMLSTASGELKDKRESHV